MNLNLVRNKKGDGGTFGTLYDDAENKLAVTVERPPTGDHPCIPVGVYPWKKFVSPHNGDCLLFDVTGRTMIEMHAANVMVELLGCIAPGVAIGHFSGVHDDEPYDLDGVTNSKLTLGRILEMLPDEGTLTVTDETE